VVRKTKKKKEEINMAKVRVKGYLRKVPGKSKKVRVKGHMRKK